MRSVTLAGAIAGAVMIVAAVLLFLSWFGRSGEPAPAARAAKPKTGGSAISRPATKTGISVAVPKKTVKSRLDQTRAAGDEVARITAFQELLRTLPLSELPAVARWITTLPDGHPQGMERGAHWEQLLQYWGSVDAEAALNFALYKAPEMGAPGGVVEEALRTWADADPLAVIERLNRLPPDALKPYHMGSLGPLLWTRAPSATLDWTLRQPEGAVRQQAVAQVAAYWFSEDAAGASKWVAERANEPDMESAVDLLTADYAATYPEGGIEWLTTLPPGKIRQEAFTEFFDTWSHLHPHEAGTLLREIAAEPELDGAVAAYAGNVMRHDFEVARVWIDAVRDPQKKAELLETYEMRKRISQKQAE